MEGDLGWLLGISNIHPGVISRLLEGLNPAQLLLLAQLEDAGTEFSKARPKISCWSLRMSFQLCFTSLPQAFPHLVIPSSSPSNGRDLFISIPLLLQFSAQQSLNVGHFGGMKNRLYFQLIFGRVLFPSPSLSIIEL